MDNLSFNFDVIAVTENWLDKQELDCVNIDGYQVTHAVREAKKGGGCSFFVNNLVNYKVVKNLCFNVNNEIESACVELDMGKEKNVIIIGSVYRAPGGSLETFNERFEDFLSNLSDSNKLVYICGD